jgi:hypothetical protein
MAAYSLRYKWMGGLMIFDLKRYQMVVIDYPIFGLNDPFVQQVLGNSFKMKIDGYNSTYTESVLPFDKSDFFGTHLIFCEEVKDELIPIFSYKSAPYDRCLKHSFEFPALTSVKNDAHPSVAKVIKDIISSVKNPETVSFDSAWAQNLNYRFNNDHGLKERLREIMMMVIVKHHQDFNLPHMITCGVAKVKTDQFFLRIGLNEVNEHAHYNQKSMDNEELVIFYNDHFSSEALVNAEKYDYIWKKRLVIDGIKMKNIGRKAAA